MADSKIEWTDKVWNPVVGCTKVSAGCERCYAIEVAHKLGTRFGQMPYSGLTVERRDGSHNWTGEARCLPERLTIPIGWKKPKRIFVNSMSDLFHEQVPDDFIAQVFGVMALTPHLTYQVLTKRPERMRAWMLDARPLESTEEFVAWWATHLPGVHVVWDPRGSDPRRYAGIPGLPGTYGSKERAAHFANRRVWPGWPLPNVWLGTSVEDQRAADERIPHLLDVPAAVRFLSAEPLLGPVDLSPWLPYYTVHPQQAASDVRTRGALDELFRAAVRHMGGPGIHWVIVGGESGRGYRSMDHAWARSLRDQCQAAGLRFFGKQDSGARTGISLPADLAIHNFPDAQP